MQPIKAGAKCSHLKTDSKVRQKMAYHERSDANEKCKTHQKYGHCGFEFFFSQDFSNQSREKKIYNVKRKIGIKSFLLCFVFLQEVLTTSNVQPDDTIACNDQN